MKRNVLDFTIVKFPVIALKSSVIYFGREKDDIVTCTKTALNKGFYKGLKIIDSDGVLFTIKDAKKVETVGPLWGYNIFLNQKLRVELNLAAMYEKVSLEDFKIQILRIINGDKFFWDSDGMINIKIDLVNKATSHFEILKKLSDDFYMKYR
jgi:hypothetical protein